MIVVQKILTSKNGVEDFMKEKNPEGERAVGLKYEEGSDRVVMEWFENNGIMTEPFETRSACRSRIEELIKKYDEKRKRFERARAKLDKRNEEDEALKELGRPSN